MKLAMVSLCLSMLSPPVAPTQGAPLQATSTLQARLDTMRANVARISRRDEKDRWQANADLWTLLLDHNGVVADIDASRATALMGAMKASVATIAAPDEKERWQANVDLWQARLGRTGDLPRSDVDRMKALMYRLRTNVEQIRPADEKQRWTANYELWDLLLAQP